MKAVLNHRASPGLRAHLLERVPTWLSVVVVDEDDRSGLNAELRDAQVLLHTLEPVTAAVIEAAPALRLIQKIGVGLNTIDLEAARRRGVAVTNMPGTNTAAVAELTLGLMLSALRRIPHLDKATRAGAGWALENGMFDRIGEVAGRTVGLIGYGAVASRLAPVLKALEATVLYTATSSKPGAVAEWAVLDDLLARSDIISLHLPLTAETAGMLDRRRLGLMRPGAVLVNTARGALVDEEALIEALTDGRLGAAALDVFAAEPVDPASPLLRLDNVVVTPHVAWLTPETLRRSIEVAIDNCRRLRDGEDLLNRAV